MKQKLYTLAFVWAVFLAFAGRAAEQIALMPQSIKNIQPTATIPSVQPLGVPRLIANDGTAASEENDKALLGLAKKFAVGMTCAFGLLCTSVFAWCKRYPAQPRNPPPEV